MVETGAASASGSIVAYVLLKLWKKSRDKSKLSGLLLLKGKTYLEENLSNNDVLFFDMDKFLSNDTPLHELPMHTVRLNLFPKATRKLKNLKNDFQGKSVVICSSCYELLHYLKIKPTKIFTIVPSPKMMSELIDDVCGDKDKYQSLEILRMSLSAKANNKKIYSTDSWDDQTNIIRDLLKVKTVLY